MIHSEIISNLQNVLNNKFILNIIIIIMIISRYLITGTDTDLIIPHSISCFCML